MDPDRAAEGRLDCPPAGVSPKQSCQIAPLSINRIYHRFTVDTADTITAMRLFQDEPKWTPHPRSQADTDGREARTSYLEKLKAGAKRAVGAAA